MMRIFLFLPIAILCTSLLSCKDLKPAGTEPNEPTKHEIKVGNTNLYLELALTANTREKGLMHRDQLGDKEGMLFVFEQPQPMRFWMKNTRIPLDIGYFSPDGRLKEVHRGQPFDLSGMPSRSKSLQFVIELNAGEYQKLGIRIGDRIDVENLTRAISLEGIDPSIYGLPSTQR